MWEYVIAGTAVVEYIASNDKKDSKYDKSRRNHPLLVYIVLLLVSEIMNERLFNDVCERKKLTYDSKFSLNGF